MMKKDWYLKPLAVAVTTVALGIAVAHAEHPDDEACWAIKGRLQRLTRARRVSCTHRAHPI